MVFDLAGHALQKIRLQFDDHENLFRYLVLATDAIARGWQKTEARVIAGMAQHDDRAATELPAAFETRPHQRGPDAFALLRRRHRQGRETHDFQLGMFGERDGRKQDVAENAAVFFCHQRNDGLRPLAQRIDEIGFGGRRESGCVQRVYAGPVFWLVEPNKHYAC